MIIPRGIWPFTAHPLLKLEHIDNNWKTLIPTTELKINNDPNIISRLLSSQRGKFMPIHFACLSVMNFSPFIHCLAQTVYLISRLLFPSCCFRINTQLHTILINHVTEVICFLIDVPQRLNIYGELYAFHRSVHTYYCIHYLN